LMSCRLVLSGCLPKPRNMITEDCGLLKRGARAFVHQQLSRLQGSHGRTVPERLNCRPPLYKLDAPPTLDCHQRDRRA
jgi:hypothetical protein